MGAVTIQQMADRVSALMEERLNVRAQGLEAKLRKGGRMLPRRVREAGRRLATAAHNSQNPKLLLQIDEEAVAQDYDTCVRHLSGLSLWDRRVGMLLGMTTSVLFSLLAAGAVAVVLLHWRGFL